MKSLLQAQNLVKSYGEVKVLKGINLDVEEKEIISIVGASGAGKSTLLHILGTLEKADAGSLSINSRQISSLDKKSLRYLETLPLVLYFSFIIFYLSLLRTKMF